jgi:phenylacetic acid degradation operon negative regulatory protein
MHRGSARSTLLNALGELVHPGNQPAPTAALLHVLGESGYEPSAARQAVTRCAGSGWIAGVRRGRESWWSLTEEGRRLVEDGIRRVEGLGREPGRWDGRWLVLYISIPHDIRAARQRLYRSLGWSGFGSPAPGIWLTPHPEREAGAKRAIERLARGSTTLSFVGPAGTVGLTDAEIVERAWSLGELDELYATLVERFAGQRPGTPLEALHALLALDEELQRLPMIDPRLPLGLAPDPSSRRAARRLLDLRAGWLPPAREHWASRRNP